MYPLIYWFIVTLRTITLHKHNTYVQIQNPTPTLALETLETIVYLIRD